MQRKLHCLLVPIGLVNRGEQFHRPTPVFASNGGLPILNDGAQKILRLRRTAPYAG